MFVIVEFANGDGLGIVRESWITPRKKEVFWPPCKEPSKFKRLLLSSPESTDDWQLYQINRFFYKTDDYEKAQKKLRLAELTSDLQTDGEDSCLKKRRRMRPRKLLVSSGDESESDDTINTSKVTSCRPPPVQLPQIVREISSPNVNTVEVDTLNTPSTSRTTYKSQLDAATSTEQTYSSSFKPHQEQNTQIIEQNKQLLSFFKNRPNTEISLNEEDFPTPIPLKTGENLKVFEDFLNTISQLKG
nr:unnamed protein product [Callosobruchus analis]